MEQDRIDEKVTGNSGKKNRPTSITVICVLGFIGVAMTLPLISSDNARQIGSWYPPYLELSAIFGIVCLVGLWYMKKWAPYAYATFVGINQIILIAMGLWSAAALIVPAVVASIALSHVKKMD